MVNTTQHKTSDQDPGPIGRLGALAERRSTAVIALWVVIVLALGALAPSADKSLSGAGWEASGSESVETRNLIDREFGGSGSYALAVVVASDRYRAGDGEFDAVVRASTAALEADAGVASVAKPVISADRGTAMVRANAAADSHEMVQAADRVKERIAEQSSTAISANLTGAPAMWSDFNAANKTAMAKSEMLSWPVTLAILLVAFGSLIAAGLPLMLTIVSLVAAAGSLYLATLISPVSIWSMNFAMMFSLALGIDYALFIVHRFRQALREKVARPVVATMDTAGKAVLLSGMTVLVSLSAIMLVPSPAFRSTALGIMLSVLFVLAASLTLLPAVLARLGARIDRFGLPSRGGSEQAADRYARWADRVWRRPAVYGIAVLAALAVLASPVLGAKTAMPSMTVVPAGDQSRVGFEQVSAAFGAGAAAPLQVVAPSGQARATQAAINGDRGITQASMVASDGHRALFTAALANPPSSEAAATTIDRLRDDLPAGALVGGTPAENRDLEVALEHSAWLVIGVVLILSFALLVFALRAPLIAGAAVLSNLLATAAAFGVAKWAFQDGGLASLLGFESQGYLDAWAPVFFFAMAFAISMDYTVFLLATAKEHWDRTHDAHAALVGGIAQSGRVIFAAGGVMVAVFFTFALSGPLPPKEMGVILGTAVLLDTFLVRLVLMPVIMRLLGPAAWHVPRWIARALPEVRFGHA